MVGTVLAAGLVGVSPVSAQTLTEALVMTYQSNPEILAQRAALRAVDENVTAAKGAWRPSVSATVTTGITDVNTENNGVTTTDDSSFPQTASVSISQPIYTGGAGDAAVASSEANVQAQRASMFSTEQSVLLSAVTAYVDVIQRQSTFELQITNVERLEKQLQATRDRFRVGEVTRTDVAQAESRVARAKADRTSAEGNLVTARVEFERVVGSIPTSLMQPSVASELPANRSEAVDMAVAGNYTLIQQKYVEAAASADVDRAVSGLYPTLNLVGAADYTLNSSGGDNETTALSAELQLVIPIYQRGVQYASIRNSKETLNQQRLTTDRQRRAVVDSAASTFESYKTTLAEIASIQSEVQSAEIALDGVQQEATVGARTVLDVLDAEQELLDAQVRLVQANRDAIVASYQLLVSIGRLTARDLGLPVEIYDYDAHYRAVSDKWFGTEPVGRMPGN
jgi:outer membrane protein